MIKAKHKIIAERLYRLYSERLLKANFSGFVLLNEFPVLNNNRGLIITPNHFSWWDGFFAEYLFRKYTGRRLFIMMLERQLKRYWFFKYAGAFSIDPSNISSVKESMAYAKKISFSNSDYLIFYPQGEIQRYENGFIKLKKGLTLLTQGSDTDVLIVSFKIVYAEEKKPSVYCRFGETISAEVINKDFTVYEDSFRKNIEMLDKGIIDNHSKDLFKI